MVAAHGEIEVLASAFIFKGQSGDTQSLVAATRSNYHASRHAPQGKTVRSRQDRMTDTVHMAHELDRVMRKIDAQMHRRMPRTDVGRIGPMGGLMLMQLEKMQPCSIQALADAMGRDNSQLTRLIRDLEGKGVLERHPHETDGRVSLLKLTQAGEAFLMRAKCTLTEVVDEIIAPLGKNERDTLLDILRRL